MLGPAVSLPNLTVSGTLIEKAQVAIGKMFMRGGKVNPI